MQIRPGIVRLTGRRNEFDGEKLAVTVWHDVCEWEDGICKGKYPRIVSPPQATQKFQHRGGRQYPVLTDKL